MNWDTAAFLATFLLILPAELPDKSFVTSIVLSARFPRFAVWVGAALAFAIQVTIAVTAGQLLSVLPRQLVVGVVLALFATGAFILLRHAFRGDHVDEDIAVKESSRSFRRGVTTSFGMLFAAEWGDLTQLVTAAQSASTGSPLSAGLGSWCALVTISALAVVTGDWLRKRMHERLLHGIAGSVMLILAVLACVEFGRI